MRYILFTAMITMLAACSSSPTITDITPQEVIKPPFSLPKVSAVKVSVNPRPGVIEDEDVRLWTSQVITPAPTTAYENEVLSYFSNRVLLDSTSPIIISIEFKNVKVSEYCRSDPEAIFGKRCALLRFKGGADIVLLEDSTELERFTLQQEVDTEWTMTHTNNLLSINSTIAKDVGDNYQNLFLEVRRDLYKRLDDELMIKTLGIR